MCGFGSRKSRMMERDLLRSEEAKEYEEECPSST